MSQEKARHFYVNGVVQMVGFRYFTREVAQGLGLSGWVRNLKDGRVEVVVEGSEEALFQLARDLEVGPPAAQVTHLEAEEIPFTGRSGFQIR